MSLEFAKENRNKLIISSLAIVLLANSTLAGEGATWQSPTESNFKNSTDLVAKADWQNPAALVKSVDFDVNPVNGLRFTLNGRKVNQGCESSCRYKTNLEMGDRPAGEYRIFAEVDYASSDTDGRTKRKDLLFDNVLPKIDEKYPTEGFKPESENFEVYYQATDAHSQIVDSKISLSSSSGQINLSSNKSSISNISTSILQPNTKYTVNYSVTDLLGNKRTGGWNFYTDKEYNADENPRISPKSPVKWSKNNNTNITATFSEGEKFDLQLKCYENGEIFDSEKETRDDLKTQGISLKCQIPESFKNSERNITLEYCDMAENCVNESLIYKFDADKPVIESSRLPSQKIKGDFKLDIQAYDSTTSVENYLYKIGNKKLSEANFNNGSILVEFSNLPRGSKNLEVVVEDSVGHRSEKRNLNFDYNPSGPTEIDFDVKSESVVSGKETDIDLNVKNLGEFYVTEEKIEVTSELGDDNLEVSHLEPGQTKIKEIRLNTTGHYGVFEVQIGSSENRKTIDYVVKPSDRQVEKIVKTYDDRSDKLSDWKSKVKELEDKNVNITSLNNSIRDYERLVSNIESNIDNSTFYKAAGAIRQIQNVEEKLSSDYSQKLNQYKDRRAKNILLLLITSVTSLVVLLKSFFWYSDEYNLEDGKLTTEIKKIINQCNQSKLMNRIRETMRQIKQSQIIKRIHNKLPNLKSKLPMKKIQNILNKSKKHLPITKINRAEEEISKDIDKAVKEISDPKFKEYDYNESKQDD